MKAPERERGRERQGVHLITKPKCLSIGSSGSASAPD